MAWVCRALVCMGWHALDRARLQNLFRAYVDALDHSTL